MNQTLERAVDAFSASPAIRLRFQMLKAREGSLAPLMPPPIKVPRHPFYDGAASAAADEHPLAHLMKLRDQAAAEVERLLTFLDETDDLDEREDVDEDDNTGDDEPSLGGINVDAQFAAHDSAFHDDREVEEGNDEPSLGFSEPVLTGDEMPGFSWPYTSTDAAQHRPMHTEATDDREADGDDLEPSLCGVSASAVPTIGGVEDGEDDNDREPDLGWTKGGAIGDRHDFELDGVPA